MMGISSSYTVTATITGGSSTVIPTVTSTTGNAISISPASCFLNSAASDSKSCVFVITSSGNYSSWDPANIANSTDVDTPSSVSINSGISLSITADNNATINGSASPLAINNISTTVLAPYIYLPAPQTYDAGQHNGCWDHYPMFCTLKDYFESTSGITWSGGGWYNGGGGGTIDSRFSEGTQSNGTACQSGQEVEVDKLTGLMWVKKPTSTSYTLAEAKLAPAIPGSYCGYTDWRLPTVNEMLSLINYAASEDKLSSAMWLSQYGFKNVQPSYYWTSTPSADPNYNWTVRVSDGSTYYYRVRGLNEPTNPFVWPVRGGQ